MKPILMDLLMKVAYRTHRLRYKIGDTTYEVEYHRSPFWAYEKPSVRLFLKKKLRTWHGQVRECFDGGSRCGFGTTCIWTLFPRMKMKKFLCTEAKRVYGICHREDALKGGGEG